MLCKEIENEISDENEMSEKPNILSQLLCIRTITQKSREIKEDILK